MAEPTLSRVHRTRLMQIWRSAGWPCRDGIEIDLLAAQLLAVQPSADGRETLKLTASGIRALAEARQRNLRAASAHDRLGRKFAELLLASGRIVWRELSLRARIDAPPPARETPSPPVQAPLCEEASADEAAAGSAWRLARPDLFSVRNTTVDTYLQPMVHEVKSTRADLLSDLRQVAKREAYRWLCGECYYVFPAAVARPEEIPEPFGVWVHHGELEEGRFELLRPARHAACTLPFAVWMTLARSTPMRSEVETPQAQLGEDGQDLP
jgi:hypothetical protein